jgi:hypothetical protein
MAQMRFTGFLLKWMDLEEASMFFSFMVQNQYLPLIIGYGVQLLSLRVSKT